MLCIARSGVAPEYILILYAGTRYAPYTEIMDAKIYLL